MATPFFDTLQYVKRLKESGISSDHAEAHSLALSDAMNDLARKTDLNELRLAVTADINELRSEITADFIEFRAEVDGRFIKVEGRLDLLKWMMGFVLAGTLSIVLKIFR